MKQIMRPQGVLLDVLIVSIVVVLLGCGGGGGGGTPTTGDGSSGTGSASTATGTGAITGVVKDGSSGEALVGAKVTAGDQTVDTVAGGLYTLPAVPTGTVLVVAGAAGYGSKSSVIFLSPGQVATVNFLIGASSSGGGGGGGGGGATATGPKILSSNPTNNSSSVDVNTQILFTLDQSVQRSTMSTNIDGTGLPSVVFSKLATPSQDDSGVSTVYPFPGLTNTWIYQPGSLKPLVGGTKYGLYVTNRLIGTNKQPSPGSSFTFTTKGGGGGGGGGTPIVGPRLIYKNPPDKSVDVDPSTRILFAFDQEMNDSSIVVSTAPAGWRNVVFSRVTPPAVDDTSFTVTKTYDLAIANCYEYKLGSMGSLSNLTTYTLFVTNQVKSKGGVPSPGESFSFATRRQDPGTGPVITSSNPYNNTTDVDTNTKIYITLSSDTDCNTVNTAGVKMTRITSPLSEITISISPTTPPVPCVTTYEILPSPSTLVGDSVYQISINNNVRNTQGVRSNGSAISFKTRSTSIGGVPVPPRLVSTNPANNTSGVDVSTRVLLSFNQEMVLASLNEPGAVSVNQVTPPLRSIVPLKVTQTSIPFTYEVYQCLSGETPECLTNTHSVSLSSLCTYVVYLNNAIQASGTSGAFLQPTQFGFTTRLVQGGAGDTSSPRLASTNPADGTLDVNTSVDIILSFNEKVRISTVTTPPTNNVTPVVLTQFTGITSSDTSQRLVALDDDGNGGATEFRYEPGTLALSPGQSYRIYLTNAITDLVGNRLQPTSFWFATSSVQAIPQGPRIASANPTKNQTEVVPTSQIIFTFDKDIFPVTDTRALVPNSSVTPTTVLLTRVSQPAEDDAIIRVVPDAHFDVISGVDQPAGVNVTHLPVIFRPDPVNFPNTFRYVSGRLTLQEGPNRYTLFVTNGVRDYTGNYAQGDAISFTTRSSTVGPGKGPRVILTNPGNGSVTGPTTRVFITFDKYVDPRTLSANTIDMRALAKAQDCSTTLGLCDLRPGADEPQDCYCTDGTNYTTSVTISGTMEYPLANCVPIGATSPVSTSVVVEVNHGSQFPNDVYGTIFVTINAQLRSCDGYIAPQDNFFFFVR